MKTIYLVVALAMFVVPVIAGAATSAPPPTVEQIQAQLVQVQAAAQYYRQLSQEMTDQVAADQAQIAILRAQIAAMKEAKNTKK
jgi:hypothetical protein